MSADDDDLTELAELQYERVGAGKYIVVGERVINGQPRTRRIPCANPAYGFRVLEREIEDLLIAQEFAKVEADAKRARGKKRKDGDG